MKIPFEREYRNEFIREIENIFDSNIWSEGNCIKDFEEQFSVLTNLHSVAVCNGGAALLALYEFIGVEGYEVIVPSNTFWATAIAAKKAGASVIYADCNKNDLCISLEDIRKKVTKKTKAIVVVHIGGHISFGIEQIADFCKQHSIALIEDCSHAHGATLNGKAAGSWGIGGAYSFYATKTMPLGEGGMVVTKEKPLYEWLKLYRNYGKKVVDGKVTYPIPNGFNFRMNEFSAALGKVQLKHLPRVIEWKHALAAKYDQFFDKRVRFPEGMVSGYYKYIVFDYNLTEETGRVFGINDLGTTIDNIVMDLPNTSWVVSHHRCVPIWYGWEQAHLSPNELMLRLIRQ